MQLRDFRKDIADPGQWGFFGGHLNSDEDPKSGLIRELAEELRWSPDELEPLGDFNADGLQIIGYQGVRKTSLDALVLGEGQELCAFEPAELATGMAYSRKWARSFPLTEITRQGLTLWCAAATSGAQVRKPI
jgi:8-oxo-dGTP pyrophosphatase MutT (NUDIX family)